MSTVHEPEDTASRLARLEERIEGMQRARDVAKGDVDRRLGEMNELRHQIDEERGRYVTVRRYDERHEELQRRLGLLESRLSNIEGGSQIKAATIGWLIAGLGILITVVVVVTNILTS